ncbi:hypothetical protein ACFY7V_03745 [[Kitasatospora] papulosa]|uniref:hypothetical protein n=1 Tax=Streptomyces TaxID=1883 RepID=UPI002FF22ECE
MSRPLSGPSDLPLILPPSPPPGPRLEYVSSPGLDGSYVTTYAVDRMPLDDPRERTICRGLLLHALDLLDKQEPPTVTTPAADGEQLPPFSGDDPLCAKCSNVDAFTDYRAAGEYGSDEPRRMMPSRKGERLERRCGRCSFTWDEALVPPTPMQLEARLSAWLTEQLGTALRTTPTSGHVHKPGEERFDHHPAPGETGHHFTIGCALCTSDVTALTSAVLDVVSRAVFTLPAHLKSGAES